MAQGVKKPPAMQETPEMWIQSWGQEEPLEKEMATHSRIPWTEEPAGLLYGRELDMTQQLNHHRGGCQV